MYIAKRMLGRSNRFLLQLRACYEFLCDWGANHPGATIVAVFLSGRGGGGCGRSW